MKIKFIILCALVLGAIAVEAGIDFVMSLSAYLSLWTVGAIIIVAIDDSFSRKARYFTLSVFTVIIFASHLMPWTQRKKFVQRLFSVTPGMSIQQARQKMSGYMEGTGMPVISELWAIGSNLRISGHNDMIFSTSDGAKEIEIKDALIFRHGSAAEYNGDWGIILLRDDKVISVKFSYD